MPAERDHRDELEEGLLSGTRKPSRPLFRQRWKKMAISLVVIVSVVSLLSLGYATSVPKATAPTFPIAESEQLNWAQYSPYFPLGKYEAPPGNCRIDQVCGTTLIFAVLLTLL